MLDMRRGSTILRERADWRGQAPRAGANGAFQVASEVCWDVNFLETSESLCRGQAARELIIVYPDLVGRK